MEKFTLEQVEGMAQYIGQFHSEHAKACSGMLLAYAERLRQDNHEFKNFHRLLCERFGYTHDSTDWRRDQLSLIEHIAERLEGDEREARDAARYEWLAENAVIETINWRRDGKDACSTKHTLDNMIDAAMKEDV